MRRRAAVIDGPGAHDMVWINGDGRLVSVRSPNTVQHATCSIDDPDFVAADGVMIVDHNPAPRADCMMSARNYLHAFVRPLVS